MGIYDKNRIYDGFSDLSAGADGGRLSNLIAKNQFAEGENVICREGAPFNRPPFLDVDLNFTNPNLTYNVDGSFQSEDGVIGQSRTRFLIDTFQEASYYSARPGKESLMATIGGRYYQIIPGDMQTADVREIALDRRNRSTIPMAYHLQAGMFHIVQDGETKPIIFDGVSARRAVPGEIFTGTIMGYGQGRIVLVSKTGDIFFGDIRDGKGNGDADLLGFTETTFLNEGGSTAIPSFMGLPIAIQFLPAQDSATGVGECLIFGQRGVESFFLSIPRDQWKESQFQRTALLETGACSHRCVAVVNQDVWFRDHFTGWRSYRQARAQIGQWAQIPMSTNVRKWIDSETANLLNYCSAIEFDNRLITTVTPYWNLGRPYHNGLLALDFDVISSFGQTSGPAWDGHWSNRTMDPLDGLKVLQLVKGVFNGRDRAFAFVMNNIRWNYLIELYPIAEGKDTAGPITSRLITRAMDFDREFNEKKLYGGDLWIDEVSQPTSVSVYYRPDQFEDFQPITTFDVNPVGTAQEITPGGVPTIRKLFAPRRSFKKALDTGDSTFTKRILRRFYEVQAKIQWTGRARMRKLRMHAQEEVEDSKAKL